MRTIIALILIVFLPLISQGQNEMTISRVGKEVSRLWKLDSNSCKGDRSKLAGLFLNAQPDSITKKFLFSILGKPNLIQKYHVGYPENKNYVEYIYYIYMDNCPKIKVEGAAIGFVFDESETYFKGIENHEYCG